MQTNSWMPADGCLRGFAQDERGATAIEYGLIAALVAVGMLVGLRALGDGNSSSWGATSNKIQNAMQGGGG